MSKKYCYLFTEGNAKMRELLGGKGANLAEMTNIGLPVPQGFTITTEACTQYYEDGRQINDAIMAEIMEYIEKMEKITGKKFGDHENPLLVSVRSGARASMPGMMDTILNLGLNEDVVDVIAKKSNNPRWAWDCYRRFIQMYSDVVMEVGKKYFEQLIDEMKARKGVTQDVELTAEDLKELAGQFKAEYKSKIGQDFPSDPKEQLIGAIKAVFRSWDNPRANVYRRDNDIPYSWGTAVNVQSMAFGNMGDDCGTGVAFTRNPATGEKKLMGEFLTNAQGEDVVAGVRTPMPIDQMAEKFPEAYAQFVEVCRTLEDHYRDMQDMEFTVEHGQLYMLQTRNGKRTAPAALKIACDLVDEGMISEQQAVAMIDPRNLDTLLHPQFDPAALKAAAPVGKALPASPGAACGKIVYSAEDAKEWAARGEKVVLVRLETSPEDIEGMKAAQGILTVRGRPCRAHAYGTPDVTILGGDIYRGTARRDHVDGGLDADHVFGGHRKGSLFPLYREERREPSVAEEGTRHEPCGDSGRRRAGIFRGDEAALFARMDKPLRLRRPRGCILLPDALWPLLEAGQFHGRHFVDDLRRGGLLLVQHHKDEYRRYDRHRADAGYRDRRLCRGKPSGPS